MITEYLIWKNGVENMTIMETIIQMLVVGKCILDAYIFMLYIYFVHLVFCAEGGKGTLEYLAWDEVVIVRQISSILICDIIYLIHYLHVLSDGLRAHEI